MSKFLATTVPSCRMHIGGLCAVLSALTLLLPAGAVAATADPALRRSEQLDVRRLGRVSDAERSVLRVEWRAAVAGDDEARAVQEMLDSLRRMEGTMGEINRLIRSMPAPTPVVATVAPEPSESIADDKNVALAAGAAIGLLALWWSRRRKPAQPRAVATAPQAGPPAANSPDGALPATAPVAETPLDEEPPASTPAVDLPGAQPKPDPVEVAKAAPGSITATEVEPSAPLPAADIAAIDFSLEEADPESVARANARLPVPRTNGGTRVPERRHEINVEPTLQLAEIMLSMGLEQGAAQALLEYAEAQPRNAVYHWLKLLGIYRKSGHREGFKATAEKLRRHFNIQADDWTKAGTGEAPTLEKFARVAEHVQQIWPRPEECIAYLRHLLEDNRDGERLGFPQPVAEEFLLLIEILKQTSGLDQAVGT